MVGFGFSTYAWRDNWIPPRRSGWRWIPGSWSSFGYWTPGYWTPRVRVVPSGYTYVPGWWDSGSYVEGYYRRNTRSGWDWTDGYYLEDGTYVRGHWTPQGQGREGYSWEAGFWDGETWIEGFWRPDYRTGYTWVSSFYKEDGVFNAGYWMPIEKRPGSVWVPGWFDGNTWNEGYWEGEDKYSKADIDNYQPEEGWNDGWQEGEGWGDGEVIENNTDEPPLAMPVYFDEDDLKLEDDGDLPPI